MHLTLALALLVADPDYKDVPLADLGVTAVPEKKDPKTGFVVGGKNPTKTLQGLTHLAGRTVADLEADMRPGAAVEVGSDKGFLGKDESLLEVLAADNRYVVDELGLTHQELARHLRAIVAIAEKRAKEKKDGAFAYHGRQFAVEIAYSRGDQLSPFKDGTKTNAYAKITNVTTGKKIEFSPLVSDMAERYGFWEGTGTPYRLAPKDAIAVLDFLKPGEKVDAKKLVGKWEAKNSKNSLIVEFTADGKTKTTSTLLPQPIEGTYTLTGNKLVTVVTSSGQDVRETLTITTLTDTELVGTLERGREKAFVRFKDKK